MMDGGDFVAHSPYAPEPAAVLIGTVGAGGLGVSFDRAPPLPVAVSAPMDSLGMGPAKKRGRPRKYAPDGTMIAAPGQPSGGASSEEPSRKRRGRPPGSAKKQQLEALGAAGIGFTPHVLTLKPGEDIASRIMAFSQQGPHTTCILSAFGDISNVTLRQPATSGGTATYEGLFKIISLSGSFLPTEDDNRSRTGGLSVALAGSDGRVLGGAVAGMLVAATPVQVFLCSFIMEGKKPKLKTSKQEPSSASPLMLGYGAASAVSPPSQETSTESSEDPDSPADQNDVPCNNTSQDVTSSYASIVWPSSNQHMRASGTKLNDDILFQDQLFD